MWLKDLRNEFHRYQILTLQEIQHKLTSIKELIKLSGDLGHLPARY